MARPGSASIHCPDGGAGAFVWGTWAAGLASAIGLIVAYGSGLPLWDDIGLIPVLAGAQPLNRDWLLSTHNEHRVPLTRLVLIGALRLSGNDFRAGMAVTVAALAASSAALIAAVRAARGRLAFEDAAIGLLFLSVSQYANLLWSSPAQFGLSAGLAVAWLAVAIRPASGWSSREAIASGVLLTLLPLCGANGLVMVPGLVLGHLIAAWQSLRAAERPRYVRTAVGVLAPLAPVAGGLAVLWRAGAGEIRPSGGSATVAGLVRTAVQFLAIGLGPPSRSFWPVIGIALIGGLAGAVVVLALAWRNQPATRARTAGLAGFLTAGVSLALAVGWGRATAGDFAGFEPRYVTLSAPWLLGLSIAFALLGPVAWSRLVPMGLLAVAGVLLWPNLVEALDHGRRNREQADAVVRDLEAGEPPSIILARHVPYLHPSQDSLAEVLPLLKSAGIGPFRTMGEEPPARERPIDPRTAGLQMAQWEGPTLVVTGVDPALVIRLETTTFVRGIRLRYAHANDDGLPARFRCEWRRDGQAAAPPGQRFDEWNLPTGQDRTLTLWIQDQLDELRIQPDNRPCRFRIDELTLLLPP